MKLVFIQQNDANSNGAVIREWVVSDASHVTKHQIIAHVETSKAIYDVEASTDGILVHSASVGSEVPFSKPIATIFEAGESIEKAKLTNKASPRITKKAAALADQYGIDIALITSDGIISEDDVRAFVGDNKSAQTSFLTPVEYPSSVKKVLVIGAGNGLAQVADILMHYPEYRIVGCVDDSEKYSGMEPFGVKLFGKVTEAKKLFKEKIIDCAIVAISSNVSVRKEIFELVRSWGIPFINAIDPSARINRFSALGSGNVICSFVHIGTYTQLGDNNFVSAHCNIDHHNIWGSHITLGPGCHFSGRVQVSDCVKFATGIFVQNGIVIGQDTTIASGAMITASIPSHSLVKTQVTYTITQKP